MTADHNNTRPLITVDGIAASGKGTLARLIAERYDGAWLDTGLLYRYAGLEGPEQALARAQDLAARFSLDLLGDPVLRSEKASNGASVSGAIPQVRAALVQIQKDFGASTPPGKQCVVMDGRDIGTVIAPHAPVKFFVTAAIEVRAARRTKELQLSDGSVSYEAVLDAMRQRDARDTERAVAPTIPAPDALVIDTTQLSVVEMLGLAAAHIERLCPKLTAVR